MYYSLLDTTYLHIPKLPTTKFSSVTEIVNGSLNIPAIPNHPTFDSLCPQRGWIFQVTSSEKNKIKGNYLASYHKLFRDYLTKNQHVKFIFVVPPHRFKEFAIQEIINTSNRSYNDKPPKMTVPWIEQYVMELDATPMMTKFETAV